MAICLPSLIGRFFSSETEPAFVALYGGIAVAIPSYFMLKALLPELDNRPSTITSAATVLGLIAAHVYVFKAMDTTPSLQMFALFTFIFFLHMDEGLL
jgi:hypothetical protein